MKSPFVFEVKVANLVSAYWGTSFKEADEVFTKSKCTTQFVQRNSDGSIKQIKFKERDKFPGVMERAFNK